MNGTRNLITRAALRWGAMSRAQKMTLVGAPAAVVVAGTGCQPTVVLARFSNGTPKMIKIIGPEHEDFDLIGAGDRTCADVGLFGVPCPNWHKPRDTAWHQHAYSSCAYGVGGGPDGCTWTGPYWSEWHPFYSAVYYPDQEWNQADHDFLLFCEINSGV